MNIADELHHRLNSKTRIRALFKDVSTHELEKILNRLNAVHAEKLQARQAADEKRQKKLDKIKTIQKEMETLGLTLSDFGSIESAGSKDGRKRRNVSKHTFQYETSAGEPVQWFGSTTGRLPKEFQVYLEKSGKKRIDCIVEGEQP